jgi:6-phosphogluconolactonase
MHSPTKPDFREFKSGMELCTALSGDIAQRLNASVSRNGRASMVVPGGTTPGAFFDVLARTPAPWEKVDITLSDDRWKESSSLRANENLIRTRLLTANAAKAGFVPLRNAAANGRAGQADINSAIAAMHRPFDVVLLGMGLDGHIASLLPGAAELDCALDINDPSLARALRPRYPDSDERMTLTLRAILNSHWIALLLTGKAKRDAYDNARAGTDAREAPVRAVLQQRGTPVSTYWAP